MFFKKKVFFVDFIVIGGVVVIEKVVVDVGVKVIVLVVFGRIDVI